VQNYIILPNWQLLNIAQTQEDVILAVSMQELVFSCSRQM